MDYGCTYSPRAIEIIYARYNLTMDWNQGPVCTSSISVVSSVLEIIGDSDALTS